MRKGWRIYYLRNNAISSVRRLYGDSTLYVIIESIMHIDIYYDKIKNKNKNKNKIIILCLFILCVVAALHLAFRLSNSLSQFRIEESLLGP